MWSKHWRRPMPGSEIWLFRQWATATCDGLVMCESSAFTTKAVCALHSAICLHHHTRAQLPLRGRARHRGLDTDYTAKTTKQKKRK